MIQTVFAAALPVGENLAVQKNRLAGSRRDGPRVAIVTGMYGDEYEGQYVAFELARRLERSPADLRGVVDIYPAINPLGLSANEHGFPHFDIDLERTFPGDANGNLTEALAAAVLEDIQGAAACIVVHSSNANVQEMTQVRIDERYASSLTPLASKLNAQLVWVRKPTAALGGSLANALNERGTPTLVVEMGAGRSLSESTGSWLAEGIFCLLEHLHVWTGPTIVLPQPRISRGENVARMAADRPGLFLPRMEHGQVVSRGDTVGLIVDPLEGIVKSEVSAPCNGILFSLRSHPVVYEGSLIGRILEDEQ